VLLTSAVGLEWRINIKRDNRRSGRNDDRAAVNDQIRASEVRLIGVDGNQVGIVSIEEALQIAVEAAMDLVQISDGDPVVCKVMDFGKKLYEEKKQKAEAKKKQHQVQIKEMKFRPGTEEGDYQIKLRNLKRFLEGGDKAKVSLRFRGREMAHQNIGMELMRRIEADLAEMGAVEQHPKLEGRQMVMVIAPGKKK
jgi:translation initiation factor IF-3